MLVNRCSIFANVQSVYSAGYQLLRKECYDKRGYEKGKDDQAAIISSVFRAQKRYTSPDRSHKVPMQKYSPVTLVVREQMMENNTGA
jgi:hypothetical protein